MTQTARRPLYYTFGNHMHWVDMQWLWGYGALPDSVRDMLHLCRQTGARGNVNFDGIGYEKMAAECPEALAELREAVQQEIIEPVGCSYGQPYGLFHGGESNIRQLTYGSRAVRRLLGVRPKSFWEEEFYFFPQLPQLLAQCGFTGASLFFQWTWHTPEVPKEPHSLILWEGIDGTRLPTLPRNTLNVHQWPEDFDGLLDQGLIKELQSPAIVQWLELMPTKDWMCRSELLLPRLKELMSDPRFEVRPRTVSQLIDELKAAPAGPLRDSDTGTASAQYRDRKGAAPPPYTDDSIPIRRYTMDDVWHGVSLGKNADNHPRASKAEETELIFAEAGAALAGLFGRPYPHWDVYPTWELDEAWRELLSAQHHDNHECEGLCGFIAESSFARAGALRKEVATRTFQTIASRIDAPEGAIAVFNGSGQKRDLYLTAEGGFPPTVIEGVPPFGYATVRPGVQGRPERISAFRDKGNLILQRGPLKVTIDAKRGLITQIHSAEFPQGMLSPDRPLGALSMIHEDGPEDFSRVECKLEEYMGAPSAIVKREARTGATVVMIVQITPLKDGIDLYIFSDDLPPSQPRMHSGLQMPIAPAFAPAAIVADQPYSMQRIEARHNFKRKYPTGDWMTSPQVFEEIQRPFTALHFIDLLEQPEGGRGILCMHDGSEQFFRDDHGVRVLLSMHDAWDEERFIARTSARLTFVPHGPITDAERGRRLGAFLGSWAVLGGGGGDVEGPAVPPKFGPLEVTGSPGVQPVAFLRESMKHGEHFPDWAGHRMYKESSGACDHPYVIRLVEWDGQPAEVTLKLAGPVALAAKTNLLGEVFGGTALQSGVEVSNATAPRGTALPGGASLRAPASPPESPGWSPTDTHWLKVDHPVDPPDFAKGATLGGQPITWSQVRFQMRPREIATIMADLVMGQKQWRDLDAKRNVWATIHKDQPV